jgi:hypothetical protein
MALRKPLVIVSGQIQQLQAGDSLDATVSEIDSISMTNGNASSITIGQAVYVEAAGSVDLAQANASSTVELLGLVKSTSIAAAASGTIQTDGILTATTVQWDAVTGGTGGLTAGSVYYLDPDAAGHLTSTAPTTAADYVVRVGLALSTTDFDITVSIPILL